MVSSSSTVVFGILSVSIIENKNPLRITKCPIVVRLECYNQKAKTYSWSIKTNIKLDGELHQNVIETLPKEFKHSPNSLVTKRPLKRVFQLIDNQQQQSASESQSSPTQQKLLITGPKTVQYRDPNLNLIRQKQQQTFKQTIRVVQPTKMMKTVKVLKNESSRGENFVPYGKLYRTVLKNGKAIQTPVVTPGRARHF